MTPSVNVNARYFTNGLKDVNLSLRGLARRMNVDPSVLVRGFKGIRPFRPQEVVQLSQHLEKPIDEILKNLGVDVPRTVKYK